LRRDFTALNLKVEQLTAAIDVDKFEADLLTDASLEVPFHVLVCTPEKLNLVIRNKRTTRPLAMVVMDEAHNIEDRERGLRIELLLATIKLDEPQSNFLLLMPFVPNASDLAQWLAPDQGCTVSIGAAAWQPMSG
jgi:replicative superfamily II helicase